MIKANNVANNHQNNLITTYNKQGKKEDKKELGSCKRVHLIGSVSRTSALTCASSQNTAQNTQHVAASSMRT
jgi:hypothetical protein